MNIEREGQPDYLITVPKRGLRIIPPAETLQKMMAARHGLRVGSWTDEEKTRLRLITESGILKKRYPTSADGKLFMQEVDYERRNELLSYAYELSEQVVRSWETINPDKDIAIILFGSITRGLVKRPEHPDPSNIDMAVIGNITDEEKELLFDAIREKRAEVKGRILSGCVNLTGIHEQCGNAGVFIQDISKLKLNNYCPAIEYIKACATALWDPVGIWGCLEREALQLRGDQLEKNRKVKLSRAKAY